MELVPHPGDGRAKLVRVTAEGARQIRHGLAVLSEIEAELAREVGATKMRTSHEALLVMVAALEEPGAR